MISGQKSADKRARDKRAQSPKGARHKGEIKCKKGNVWPPTCISRIKTCKNDLVIVTELF